MLFMLSLLCVLAFLCMFFQKRFERMLAPYVCGLMLIAYALAMFQWLQWLCWLAYAGAIFSVLWVLYQIVRGRATVWQQRAGRLFFTPGLLCFAILAILSYSRYILF
ncbi:MAG: hypothetical protein FWF86_02415 [Clostridia bacterium]|nr:hypothetical protein [Clostridia bacterium]